MANFGLTNQMIKRYFIIIKYSFKILMSPKNKYIKLVYQTMLNDIDELPNKTNWASLVGHLGL